MSPRIFFVLLQFRTPFLAVPYFCHHIQIEFWFMTDEKNTALVFFQGAFQLLLGIYIQMVGWLVQKEDVGWFIQNLA